MPETWYLVAVMALGFVITFALRAVPFAILKPLRESAFVEALSGWMPVGILAILALTTFLSSAGIGGEHLLPAALAASVTVGAHLLSGRRTLVSVGAGTLTYVVLVNFF